MPSSTWQAFVDLSQMTTAVMSVAGVVVAAILGWRGIQVAGRSLDRASKDHLAERARECSSSMARVHREVAQVKGALHPYWKGSEFKKMKGQRLAVIARESQVHERMSLLEAELAGLQISLEGLTGVIPSSRDGQPWNDQIRTAKAAAALVGRAAMTHYLSLVPDDDSGSASPELWVEAQMFGFAHESTDPWERKTFDEWLTGQDFAHTDDLAFRSIVLLEGMTDQLNGEIVKLTGDVMSHALPAPNSGK